MKKSALIALILSISVLSCDNDLSHKIVGNWQGIGNKGHMILVEFTRSGDYNLTLNGAVSTSATNYFGQIKYKIDDSTDPMKMSLYDEKTNKVYSKLQARFENEDLVELELFVNDEPVDRLRLKRL